MASPDHANQLDQTLDALGNEPAALSPQAAAGTIDRWLNAINDASRDDLNNVATALGELRQQLLSTPLNGGAIAGVLTRLADHTAEAAQSADDDLRPRLERLADRLRRFAGALRPSQPAGAAPDVSDKTQMASTIQPGKSAQGSFTHGGTPTGSRDRGAERGDYP